MLNAKLLLPAMIGALALAGTAQAQTDPAATSAPVKYATPSPVAQSAAAAPSAYPPCSKGQTDECMTAPHAQHAKRARHDMHGRHHEKAMHHARHHKNS